MRMKVIFLSLLFIVSSAFAESEGKRRFVMDVSVSGFFSPEVKSAEVISLEANSNAEKAGIAVGDQLVAVQDCKIPGCPAKKAKKLMTKQTGEVVSLSFRRQDNSTYSVDLVLE